MAKRAQDTNAGMMAAKRAAHVRIVRRQAGIARRAENGRSKAQMADLDACAEDREDDAGPRLPRSKGYGGFTSDELQATGEAIEEVGAAQDLEGGRRSKGTSVAGVAFTAWINALCEWPLSWLQRFVEHADTPISGRAAARRLINTDNPSWIGGVEFDRIVDRTIGRPVQRVHVAAQVEVSGAELLAETRRLAGVSADDHDVLDVDAAPSVPLIEAARVGDALMSSACVNDDEEDVKGANG